MLYINMYIYPNTPILYDYTYKYTYIYIYITLLEHAREHIII